MTRVFDTLSSAQQPSDMMLQSSSAPVLMLMNTATYVKRVMVNKPLPQEVFAGMFEYSTRVSMTTSTCVSLCACVH